MYGCVAFCSRSRARCWREFAKCRFTHFPSFFSGQVDTCVVTTQPFCITGIVMLVSHRGEYMANGLTNAVRHEFVIDNFLKTHYRFVQIVNVGTRGNAVLDKIWTNMDKLYMSPITLSELGKSDHNMVLLKPGGSLPCSTGSVMRVTTRAAKFFFPKSSDRVII